MDEEWKIACLLALAGIVIAMIYRKVFVPHGDAPGGGVWHGPVWTTYNVQPLAEYFDPEMLPTLQYISEPDA